MNEAILHTLRLSRAYCAEKLFWFAPALYECNIVITTKVAVAGIDNHYNIYFNPRAIETISKDRPIEQVVQEIGFLWIHEISHVLRDHSNRAKELNADKYIWNISADFEINDSSWKKELAMPKNFPGLLPEKYGLPKGRLAEFYYDTIYNDEILKKSIFQSLQNFGKWNEGSGVNGFINDWEKGQKQMIPIYRTTIERNVAIKLKDFQKNNTIEGNWYIWVDWILKSKINWKKILQYRMNIATNIGGSLRVDYSFSKPSRRQNIFSPILTPSFSGERKGEIVIVLDTSFSMGTSEISQAVGEVLKVLNDLKMPLIVIPCDSKAYSPLKIKSNSDKYKITKLIGGGTTNLLEGIKAALKFRPDSILVLTDGNTTFPKNRFNTPVLFGIISRNKDLINIDIQCPPWDKKAIIFIPIEEDLYIN